MGLEPSPELLAIVAVNFVRGVLGLADIASEYFYKDDLAVQPAAAAMLLGFTAVPWMIKPLYGFLSDSFPLFGYRRRSYLVLCGLAGSCAYAVLAGLVSSPAGATVALTAASLSTAFSDVITDAIAVERSRGQPQATAGSLQSLCWVSSAAGGVATAYFSGSLVQARGTRFVFGLTAIFPLLVSLTALLIDEVPTHRCPVPHEAPKYGGSSSGGRVQEYASVASGPPDPEGEKACAAAKPPPEDEADLRPASVAVPLLQRLSSQLWTLWLAITAPHILLPTLFIFVSSATPTYGTAMFYFETNVLGFTPSFLGWVSLAGAIASLVGALLYNGCLKEVPLRPMLLWCILLGALLGSTDLILVSGLNRRIGISDEVFVLGDDVIVSTVYEVAMMPVLVLAAQLCPEGVEATLFATLMSVMNAASSVGRALGAGLTAALGVTSDKFVNMFWLVLVCNLLSLLPLPFVGLLPLAPAVSHKEDGEQLGPHDTRGGGERQQPPGRGEPEEGSGRGHWFSWWPSRRKHSEGADEERRGLMAEVEMR